MTTQILKTQLQFHCSLLMGEQKNTEFYSLLFYNTELLIFLHAFKHNFLAKKTMQFHIEQNITYLRNCLYEIQNVSDDNQKIYSCHNSSQSQ